MLKSSLLSVLVVFALARCARTPSLPVAPPHYVVGPAWHGEDAWFYPEEQFVYRSTGLAVRQTHARHYITADGELWSESDLTGAHQTLQLPAVVKVRNLRNGSTVKVRLNDRGPSQSGRVLAVTPRVADLLKMGAGPAPIEIVEDERVSRRIAESSPKGVRLEIARAPSGRVTARSLEDGSTHNIGSSTESLDQKLSTLYVPHLKPEIEHGASSSVTYYIILGDFYGRAAARHLAAHCQARIKPRHASDKGLIWSVERGPFREVAEADRALAEAHACTSMGARIDVR